MTIVYKKKKINQFIFYSPQQNSNSRVKTQLTLLKENSGAATYCEGRKRAMETGIHPPCSLHNQVRPIR